MPDPLAPVVAGDDAGRHGQHAGQRQDAEGQDPAAGAVVGEVGEVPAEEEQVGQDGRDDRPHQADCDADQQRARVAAGSVNRPFQEMKA